MKKNPTVGRKGNLDELLIEAVKRKRGLYDFRVPASERTNLRKNALWMEVSNQLQGILNSICKNCLFYYEKIFN